MRAECICGAEIIEVNHPTGTIWLHAITGGQFCYPNADNATDREARHEPYEG